MAQAINLRLLHRHKPLLQISTGILFGFISIIGMTMPVTFAPGIIFDPRSVVLCVTGFFAGPWSTLIAAVMAGGYRLSLGGVGANIGLAIIAVSSLLGLAYRHAHRKGWVKKGFLQFLVFGFTVHAACLSAFAFFPTNITAEVMRNVALPFLIIFTLATACLGTLLEYIQNHLAMETALQDSEARYARVIAGSEQGYWEWHLKTQELVISPSFASMLGYELDEMPKTITAWTEYLHPTDRARFKESLNKHRAGLSPAQEVEARHRMKSGDWKWILTRGKIVSRDDKGQALIISGTHTDIAERKAAQDELELASLVYRVSSEAMTITDANATILAVNAAFTETTGYTAEEVIGKNPSILQSGHHGKSFYDAMWRALDSTGSWQGEIWNRRKNGELYPEWLNINTTYNEDGSIHRRVALFSDITKKKQLEDLLWQQANIDLLTGLPNRRMLLDRLQQEMNKADRNQNVMALLFLDLDSFKDINDTLGHDVGDALLREVAQRLAAAVRRVDTVARLGGDEFTILLSELPDPGKAESVAQKILRAFDEAFLLDDELIYVSASFGITFYPSDAATPEDLLKNADQAMYAAKYDGKNTYHYFTHSMQEAAQERRRLINDLRIAIKDNQISVHYQPIFDMRTGRISKAEALVRWMHPERGMIPPIEFIHLAEETGLIAEIGDFVFQEAARFVKRIRDDYAPGFQISVNKSAVQFRRGLTTFEAWLDYMQELALAGNSIVIEITESLLMNNHASTIRQFERYHQAGLQIALDDFGTGYASLSYLKKFSMDYIKIDKSFVRNLDTDSQDKALCEAIIVMAHTLGIKVVAEGVETESHKEVLTRIGCDFAQGYLFSRPIPENEFLQLLKPLVVST